MNIDRYLSIPHGVFDVESFGLHGASFAVAAVLLKSDGERLREVQHFAATDRAANRPWTLVTSGSTATAGSLITRFDKEHVLEQPNRTAWIERGDFNWLQANIPESVFAPGRLTGDLSIHQLFDAFVEAAGPDVMLWAECPVPVEANFLNELWGRGGKTPIPILHDIASLADPLGIPDERVDAHKPAHDPLNDARASARRLVMALGKLARLREP